MIPSCCSILRSKIKGIEFEDQGHRISLADVQELIHRDILEHLYIPAGRPGYLNSADRISLA